MSHKAKWEYFRAVYERHHNAGRRAPSMEARRVLEFGHYGVAAGLPAFNCSVRTCFWRFTSRRMSSALFHIPDPPLAMAPNSKYDQKPL